jgi:hypothetical protein
MGLLVPNVHCQSYEIPRIQPHYVPVETKLLVKGSPTLEGLLPAGQPKPAVL